MINGKLRCRQKIQDAAMYFRLGMEAQASEELVAFVDSFVWLLRRGMLDDAERVQNLLNELLLAQARKDYLRVADLLEYEIARLL